MVTIANDETSINVTKEHFDGSMRYGVWDGRAQFVVDTILSYEIP